MRISFSQVFYGLASVIAIVAIMHFAKGILIPISFSFLIAFILYPIVRFLIGKGLNRVFAIILTMLAVLICISGILYLFSAQIVNIASEYTNFLGKLRETLDTTIRLVNENVAFVPEIKSEDILLEIQNFFTDSSFLIISDTVSFTSSFFSYFILAFIYTFLILFYSKHLTAAMMTFSGKEHKVEFRKMLGEVHHVGKQYFTGTVLLMLVLGVLNSVGLLLLGIDYPFFFGFLAAVLAIIPYVGSAIGGLIPTLYAFVAYDSYLYPLGVVIIFWVIQFLEGNFLNPKIVGGNLRINALFSILSLIAGGFLWGLSGMILFLPFAAILRVICNHYVELRPIAALLGDTIPEEPIVPASVEPSGAKATIEKVVSKLKDKFTS